MTADVADFSARHGTIPLAINARFRNRPVTGVERYALEVSRRLEAELSFVSTPRLVGSVGGHLWEQVVLPLQANGRLLWSPCNTGPLLQRRQVVTIHDAAFADRQECFSPRFVAWYNWLLPRLARSVERVITVSEFSRARIVEICGVDPSKVSVIPNGVDGRFRRPDAGVIDAMRDRLGLTGDYILGVGSLEPRKNLAGLLVAWSHVRRRHPGLQLAIAGHRSELRFRDSGLGTADLSGVKLLGYVKDGDLPALYAGALTFVYPSTYEGFGLPPLEAMACGTPVICSNTTALPELVGDAALLADPADPAAMADAVCKVIETPSLAAGLRTAGVARAAIFTWERTAAATASVLYAAATAYPTSAAMGTPARSNAVGRSGPRTTLFIGHTSRLGGSEVSLLNLVTHLDPRRYRPIVMLFEEGELAEQLRARAIEVCVLPLDAAVMETRKDSLGIGSVLMLGRVRTSVRHSIRVARQIRRLRPAVVHTNSLKADLIGGLAARLVATPVIWHVRDRIANDYLPPRVVRLFRWLAKWVPTHVIANSSATLGTLSDDADARHHFTVIHNGTVIHDGVETTLADRADERGHQAVVGLIGRISPWKGQDVFLRAAAKVRAAGVECEYRIIGSALFGEQAFERTLHELAAMLGLDDVVRFTGFKSDVQAEIAQLDLVVHASTVPEPFGQVIIEGMVASRPVIATRAGGVVEIVEDGRTGLLVTPGDVDDLAAAILRVVRDADLAMELGRAGRASVLARFSIDRVARDVERLYDRVLERRP